jgi:hypothetical protein
MESDNYRIDFDSINSGGTDNSVSSNYRLWDTVGEQATGESASTLYKMHAGYRQMNSSFISISAPPDVNLTNLSGIVGGTSNGSAGWKVVTDNVGGYSMTIQASTSPALKTPEEYFFEDYTPVGAVPDFSFSLTPTKSLFGFSPEGTDIILQYKDNGTICGVGSSDAASSCWDGFSTTPKIISEKNSSNQPLGSTTTVQFRAGIGSSKIQEAGIYNAVITVTAVTL